MKEIRLKNYSQTVVDNLRRSQPNLAKYTDDQIDKAHREWSVSEDFPDEALIAHWVTPIDYDMTDAERKAYDRGWVYHECNWSKTPPGDYTPEEKAAFIQGYEDAKR